MRRGRSAALEAGRSEGRRRGVIRMRVGPEGGRVVQRALEKKGLGFGKPGEMPDPPPTWSGMLVDK